MINFDADFVSGGVYQDEVGYTGRSSHGIGCKSCPVGHYVPPTAAPGKAVRECVLCPQGWWKPHSFIIWHGGTAVLISLIELGPSFYVIILSNFFRVYIA